MINVPTDGMVALEDPHTPFQIRADAALADGQFNASAVFDIPLVQLTVAPRDARATRADGVRRSQRPHAADAGRPGDRARLGARAQPGGGTLLGLPRCARRGSVTP